MESIEIAKIIYEPEFVTDVRPAVVWTGETAATRYQCGVKTSCSGGSDYLWM